MPNIRFLISGSSVARNTKENSTPQEELGRLPLRGPVPRPGVRLHKRNVFLVIAGLALILGYATLDGLGTPGSEQPDALKNIRPSNPADAVKNLPSDYSAIPKPRAIIPPLAELGGMQVRQIQQGSIEKYLEEQKLERVKKALKARQSEVSFPSFKVPEQGLTLARLGSVPNEGGSPDGSPLVGAASSRDDENLQDEKYSFLESRRDRDTFLTAGLQPARSEFQLMAGTLISGLLLTGINSDLPGKILAQVSQNVFDTATGRYLLIPQGTKLLGEYDSRVSYGQERVLIVWTRLIFPDASSLSLEGMPGVDLSGYAGLSDQVNNHYGKLLSGVVFSSLLGAAAQVSHGSNQFEPPFSEVAVQGAADNLNQAGQQITRKNLNVQPTLEIRPGYRVNVFVTKDIVLKQYTE